MDVSEAILSRRSVRGFTSEPVPRKTIERILELAVRAPSGTNMQPWRIYVATGAVRQAITDEVLAARHAGDREGNRERPYYPPKLGEPYISRRRKVGWDLYNLLGIQKGDKDKMFAQHNRNFEFFGAPVGLFFFIERYMEIGSWLDYGMMLENVMLAAREFGLHTCPQAAWPAYHEIVRKHVGASDEEELVCGMSLGYEDESEIANSLRTERAPMDEVVTWCGFE